MCPNCEAQLLVKNRSGATERTITCPKCQTPISVNFAAAEAPAPLMPVPPPEPPEAPEPIQDPEPPENVEQPSRGGSGNGWLIGLLCGIIVVLAGVLVWFVLHKDTPRFDEEESVWDPAEDSYVHSASVAPSVSVEASWAASASVAASAEPYYYDYASTSVYPEASTSVASYYDYYEEVSRVPEASASVY